MTVVRAHMEDLLRAPPLWPVDEKRWADILDRVCAFADAWEAPALANRWDLIDLYGLHRRAPGYNLASMGAAWMIARSREVVLAVAEERILVGTETGNQLSLRRRLATDPDTVLAWELARAGVR